MAYINIDEPNQVVELYFDETNCNSICNKIRNWNYRSQQYNTEELKTIENAFELLKYYPYAVSVNADIDDEFYVDDEVIKEKYENINADYENKTELFKRMNELKTKYPYLLLKLNNLSFGIGDQTPLTKDEINLIREYLYE